MNGGRQSPVEPLVYGVCKRSMSIRERRLTVEEILSNRVRMYFFVCFFFSSRRRHTRSKRDWSSDVCSSDLVADRQRRVFVGAVPHRLGHKQMARCLGECLEDGEIADPPGAQRLDQPRAVSREIGRASCREKCRSRWSPYH